MAGKSARRSQYFCSPNWLIGLLVPPRVLAIQGLCVGALGPEQGAVLAMLAVSDGRARRVGLA